jgi:hypothetical protein
MTGRRPNRCLGGAFFLLSTALLPSAVVSALAFTTTIVAEIEFSVTNANDESSPFHRREDRNRTNVILESRTTADRILRHERQR